MRIFLPPTHRERESTFAFIVLFDCPAAGLLRSGLVIFIGDWDMTHIIWLINLSYESLETRVLSTFDMVLRGKDKLTHAKYYVPLLTLKPSQS